MTTRQAGLTGGEFLARAQAAIPQLGPTDQRVIDAILSAPEEILRLSVTELASRAGTAPSSAVRACQRMGFRGFQDVKLTIARDLGTLRDELSHEEGIDGSTPPAALLTRILHRSGRALVDAATTVDPDVFGTTVQRLALAARLLVIGNGTSAAPAADTAYRFTTLGLMVSAPSDAIAQHLAARHLDSGCACLVVSHTGATRETLVGAEAAKATGAFLVVVSSYLHSPLARLADAALIAGGPEQGFRLEAMTSRLAHLGVLDAPFCIVFGRHSTS
jgi:RpiR family transcriptional regulator, carbohydrate utilization regulator